MRSSRSIITSGSETTPMEENAKVFGSDSRADTAFVERLEPALGAQTAGESS